MKFKKIKKVCRIFFPKIFSAKELFENQLNSNQEIVFFEKKGQCYEITLKNGIKLKARDENYSDYLVLEQIFNFKEYEIILGMIQLNHFSNEKAIIIDAGANVGYTSMLFSHYLQSSIIYGIEPSFENATICIENISSLRNQSDIFFYQKALSHKAGMTYSLDRDFRDGKDWAITTKSDGNGIIEGISINEIIQEHCLEYITLLKIDIEGAERFIFDVENDLSFLKRTKIIAIEIHDEFNIRDSIYAILKENNFYLFESGELTIGINIFFLGNE
jgi:FkbM family methyltransferase